MFIILWRQRTPPSTLKRRNKGFFGCAGRGQEKKKGNITGLACACKDYPAKMDNKYCPGSLGVNYFVLGGAVDAPKKGQFTKKPAECLCFTTRKGSDWRTPVVSRASMGLQREARKSSPICHRVGGKKIRKIGN
jgi:hypothetical protein